MKTILMTGAAGRIGTFLRPELAGKYQLRLSDLKPIRDLRPGETFVRADISKLSDMLRVTKGVDAVVHFGGQSGEHDWQHILSANIVGFYNALEAARRNGVKRFLVATSNHAVGFYRCDETIDHRVYPEARQPLWRVEGLQRGVVQSLRGPLRHGDVLHAHRQRESRADRSAPARDLGERPRHGAARHDRHRDAEPALRDRLRHLGQQGLVVRQQQRLSSRLPATGSERAVRGGNPQAGGTAGNLPADIFQGGGHCMSEGGTRSRLAGEMAPARTKRSASISKAAARSRAARNR